MNAQTMKAERDYKKGEVISTLEPEILFPASSCLYPCNHFFGVTFCRTCGCPLTTSGDSASASLVDMGNLPRHKNTTPLTPHLAGTSTQSLKDNYGWSYCSKNCQEDSADLYKCIDRKDGANSREESNDNEDVDEDEDDLMNFFRREFPKRGQSPTIDDIAMMAACLLHSSPRCASKIKEQNYCRRTNQGSQQQQENDDTGTGTAKIDIDMSERIMECWIILKSYLCNRNRTVSNDASEVSSLAMDAFYQLYQNVRQRFLFQISIDHPLVDYITNTLLTLNEVELEDALNTIDMVMPGIIIDQDGDIAAIDTDTTGSILRWRSAVRLVQAINGNIVDDNELGSLFNKGAVKAMTKLRRNCFVFCPNIIMEHSCVPNCIVEASSSPTNVSSLSLSSQSDEIPSRVRVSIVALHDIQKGMDLTTSRIDDLSDCTEDRKKQLQLMFGSTYTCKCVRCIYEKGEGTIKTKPSILIDGAIPIKSQNTSIPPIQWMQLKQIADLAMQNAEYQVACDIYDIVLRIRPTNGDVLHARCATYLERNKFKIALEMWKNAYRICPSHDGISLQVKKQKSYHQLECSNTQHMDCSSSTNINIDTPPLDDADSYIELIPNKCFNTLPGSPLISPEECSNAIEWAESAAKDRSDGWTTSRHYAVPTTDIPVHEIPKLLEWFNDVMKSRLRRLLARQFGEDEVGMNGSGVFIHDAFIVRYDASGGQKHLPLHRDQSSHSFTIALNSWSEYDGGGTYIAELDRSVRPSKGGALSFRGDQLLHGGDPVVRGRRYIIVAFCYICKEDEDTDALTNPKAAKRIKLDGLFQKKNDEVSQAQDNFTFGFKF